MDIFQKVYFNSDCTRSWESHCRLEHEDVPWPWSLLSVLLYPSTGQWTPHKATHTMILITFLEFSLPFIWVSPCNLDAETISDGWTATSEPSPLRTPQTVSTVLTLLLWVLPQMVQVSRITFILISPYLVKVSLKIWHRRQNTENWMESEKAQTW